MRIGFFTDSYLPRADGIAISVETYRAGLEELGHEVYVFCQKRPEAFIAPTRRIYRFPSLPSFWYENYRDTFPFLPKHVNYIRSLKLDLVHTFTPAQIGLLGLYIARRDHIPLVATCNFDFNLVREYLRILPASVIAVMAISLISQRLLSRDELNILLKPENPRDDWLQRLVKISASFYFNQCDVVTVQSKKMKRAIEFYTKKPVVIVPVGINFQLIPKKVDTLSIRAQYGLPQKTILFVSSSRLVKEKRIDFLIRAYAQLSPEDRKKSALILVGEGPLANSLKKLVADLGLGRTVIFTGLVNHREVFTIVSACDVYVHASLRETQGLVLNEAAACGKPLIMIERQVNPILQEGKNGLFSSDDLVDFSRKMGQLLHDNKLRLSFGIESSKRAKSTSQQEVSRQLDLLYKKILTNSL